MKYLAFLLFISHFHLFAQVTKKVCFLGNSYIYTNDVPSMIASIASADGNTLIKDQNTPGGFTFMGHSTNATSLSKISSDSWDYVVLQEQSQFPSFPWSQVQTDVLPYAEVLVDSIRAANTCAIPLFFNTWGRLNGDPQWDSINTFDKMNIRLFNAYSFMVNKHTGKMVPVGIGFDHVQNDLAPAVTHAALYSGDGSHPSVFGTYLAACMFYEIIFDASCIGNSYLPVGITAPEASYLQVVANHVVHQADSVEVDFTQPFASFSYTSNGLEVSFINESEHAFDWTWNFGDGNISTEENPSHTFSSNGSYSVLLTAEYCGNTDDTTIQVNFTLNTNGNAPLIFNVVPNPSNGHFNIIYNGNEEFVEIWTMEGTLYSRAKLGEPLPPLIRSGQYIVKIGPESRMLIIN